jgi:hypothetical protein
VIVEGLKTMSFATRSTVTDDRPVAAVMLAVAKVREALELPLALRKKMVFSRVLIS